MYMANDSIAVPLILPKLSTKECNIWMIRAGLNSNWLFTKWASAFFENSGVKSYLQRYDFRFPEVAGLIYLGQMFLNQEFLCIVLDATFDTFLLQLSFPGSHCLWGWSKICIISSIPSITHRMVRVKETCFNISDVNLRWAAGPITNDTFQIVFLRKLDWLRSTTSSTDTSCSESLFSK